MKTETTNPKTLAPGEQRPSDELANLITHGLGLLLSLIASSVLMMLVQGSDTRFILACGAYCLSLVGLYAASTLSHSFKDLGRRRFFRTIDQVCIYFLIAGSFTPIAVAFLWNGYWPWLLFLMWVLALSGAALVLAMRNLTPMAKLTYGLLGWLPVISLKALVDAAPFSMLAWILAGGVFYSTGTLFLKFDQQIRYFHALWHTFVIAGSICHYVAIIVFVVP